MTSEALPTEEMGRSAADKPMRKRIRPMDWAMVASLAVILGMFIYTSVFTKEIKVIVVSVVSDYPYHTYARHHAAGVVSVKRRAEVVPKVSGTLAEFTVTEGELVEKGRVVALLESDDAVARRERAEGRFRLAVAGLEQAREELAQESFNLEQYSKLFEMGSVSRSEYRSAEARYHKAVSALDTAESAVKAGAAALRKAEAALGHTRVEAPLGGMILFLDAEIGDSLSAPSSSGGAGTPLATIVDVSSLAAEVVVPEIYLERVNKGQPCVIVLDDLPGEFLAGEVSDVELPQERGRLGALVRVRILGHDPRIRPDMAARVSFLSRPMDQGDETPRTMVHASAVVTRQGVSAVYLVEDGHAVLKRVRLGDRFGDRVEILGGVSVGDMLVANPPRDLKNGSRLFVRS
jgi:RND family efflux transporter MFP subunit